jgi:glucosamine--fructose-6-phosphate aminotransferase (isomerizing)
MTTYTEIFEQAETIDHTLASQHKAVQALAVEIKKRKPAYLFLAARGTSDNAARYANYLFGSRNRLALALATPSLFTYYHTPPRLDHSVVIGISQSGQSPDILSVLEEGKKQGNLTAVLTNDVNSPMAQTADHVLALEVGEEHGVAATKTYTAELMLLAMLSAAMDGTAADIQDLSRVQGWVKETLAQDELIASLAQEAASMQNCVVLGRGFNYSTAFEWALKMKELSYVEAEPYSSADFLHGPVAMVAGGFPILAVVAKGAVADSMNETLKYLKENLKARLFVISNEPQALKMANYPITLPADMPEWLSPIAAILPAQLFAYHLTRARGFDPDNPRTIHKVTRTK